MILIPYIILRGNTLKFLFWNTYRNTNINDILSNLIVENDVDIAVLAEYESDLDKLIDALLSKNITVSKYITTGSDKIKMLGKVNDVIPQTQSKHYSIQIIKNKYIMCGAHLPSKLYGSGSGQRAIVVRQLLRDLVALEDKKSIDQTIIVGDMNENPYEECCLDARWLNSLPSRMDTKRKSRIIQKETFEMFYNPMWNLFGDFSGPPGSYYFNKNDTDNPMWHILDQVIIRPPLIRSFVNDSLRIIDRTSKASLLDKRGHPNKKISDHLPIFFEIKE